MQAFCTICSKDKDHTTGLLPAYQRYVSGRIRHAVSQSQSRGLPLFFLSGEFGLIPGREQIPDYDHLLDETEVAGLVKKVAGQLKAQKISKLFFLAKIRETPGWEPYYRLIERACRQAGVELRVENI